MVFVVLPAVDGSLVDRFANLILTGGADRPIGCQVRVPIPGRKDLLLCPAEYGLGRIEGLQVLALAVGLVGVRIVEGARVRLGGDPVR